MIQMNVFRILGDVSHTASKCILIWAIHSNRSAEGVSLITQVLYVGVFITRYLDLFWVPPSISWWNFILKNFYIFSSLYIIFLMMRVYARTREREKAWRMGAYCLGGSIVLTPVVIGVNVLARNGTNFSDILWTFSIILESVCVIPQLLLLRQTTVPTVIDSFYLLTLGSYRGFYILNWIIRLASPEHHFEWRAVLFGIIQTGFYVDFAWVYWTRQRVKLRNGGVVDSDDLSRGFLVSRVLGRGEAAIDDEEAGEGQNPGISSPSSRKAGRWGPRGISVSADEGMLDTQPKTKAGEHPGDSKARDAEFARMLGDDASEESSQSLSKQTNGNPIGKANEHDWRD